MGYCAGAMTESPGQGDTLAVGPDSQSGQRPLKRFVGTLAEGLRETVLCFRTA